MRHPTQLFTDIFLLASAPHGVPLQKSSQQTFALVVMELQMQLLVLEAFFART